MGAFSYILGNFLFLQCGLAFGSDFSRANWPWEVVHRITEHLAECLLDDDTLRSKHRKYLDKLQWHKKLGSRKAKFTPAKRCSLNTGITGVHRKPVYCF